MGYDGGVGGAEGRGLASGGPGVGGMAARPCTTHCPAHRGAQHGRAAALRQAVVQMAWCNSWAGSLHTWRGCLKRPMWLGGALLRCYAMIFGFGMAGVGEAMRRPFCATTLDA